MTSTGYAPFKGTAVEQGDVYRLTAEDGQGVIEVPKADVNISGGAIEIRVGATATVINQPANKQAPDLAVDRNNCPSGKTWCIGLIMGCCDNGKIIGVCIGGWGC